MIYLPFFRPLKYLDSLQGKGFSWRINYTLRIHDKINSLHDFNQSHSPPGFEFRQLEGCVIFYRLKFDNFLRFPTILEFIRTEKGLHVQLQYDGIPLPLPSWSVNGHDAKVDKLNMLENFPPYIRSTINSYRKLTSFTWRIKTKRTLQTYG